MPLYDPLIAEPILFVFAECTYKESVIKQSENEETEDRLLDDSVPIF